MSRLRLDDDVLLEIASFADNGTLRSLMKTRLVLLEYGAKRLLSTRNGVALYQNEERISSFVSFMLKEGHSTYRLKLLRSLHLYWPSIPRPPVSPEATGMALARLFRSLAEDGDLHNLSIHGAEQIVGLHPDVSAAIAQLTTLEWLNVADARRRIINMLSGLRCPLKVAIISLGSPRNEADGRILSILDKHLLWSLQPFTVTLKYLTIATRRFSAPDDPVFPIAQRHLSQSLHRGHPMGTSLRTGIP